MSSTVTLPSLIFYNFNCPRYFYTDVILRSATMFVDTSFSQMFRLRIPYFKTAYIFKGVVRRTEWKDITLSL